MTGEHAPTPYDTIGTTYAQTRQPDPRIRDAIRAGLGAAKSVVNVGAGTGSYEPPETVLAVEPSRVMIAQRPPGLAPAVITTAERIPLPDKSVDAALCILTIHHWPDLAAGIGELRRVASRGVFFTWDRDVSADFWLLREYFPEMGTADYRKAVPLERLARPGRPVDGHPGSRAARLHRRVPRRVLAPARSLPGPGRPGGHLRVRARLPGGVEPRPGPPRGRPRIGRVEPSPPGVAGHGERRPRLPPGRG